MSNKAVQLLFTKSKLNIWIILFINLSYLIQIRASHSAGADLNLKCLGGLQYEVTINFYVDCAGAIPLSLLVGAYESASCGVRTRAIRFRPESVREVSQLCATQVNNSTCNGGTLQGFKLYIYVDTITLPMQCDDWRFFYQVTYRNAVITNIANPGNTYFYVETTLDNLNAPCNNSPIFTTSLIPYVCDGVAFTYNHGGIDPDGDSLAYALITPLEQSGNNITFIAPFTANQPMTTTGPFNFDNASGQMSFTPNGAQVIITAVEVREYRNGQLIGRTVRDMQIVVGSCNNNPPVPSPLINLNGATQNGNTLTACEGSVISFSITTTDLDNIDSIDISSNIIANLPGATTNITGTNPTTINVSWATPIGASSFYAFALSFEDNACPIKSRQSIGYSVRLNNCLLLSSDCTDFRAQWSAIDKRTQLYWTLNEELGNRGFFIERSIDGYSYESIDWIPSKGTNSVSTTYEYTDNSIYLTGQHYYYRIKEIDSEGVASYICRIQDIYIPEEENPQFIVYPNPVRSTSTLCLKSPEECAYELKIYNVLGKLLEQKRLEVKEGVNRYPLSLDNYPIGTYFLQINAVHKGIGSVFPILKNR